MTSSCWDRIYASVTCHIIDSGNKLWIHCQWVQKKTPMKFESKCSKNHLTQMLWEMSAKYPPFCSDISVFLLFLLSELLCLNSLTPSVTHICVINLAIIGSDNGLAPSRRQVIIWTSTGILSIAPLGTNFSEILIQIQTFSFMKMDLKVSSAKWRPFYLGLNMS